MTVWVLWENWADGPYLIGVYADHAAAVRARDARVGYKDSGMFRPVKAEQLEIEEEVVQS